MRERERERKRGTAAAGIERKKERKREREREINGGSENFKKSFERKTSFFLFLFLTTTSVVPLRICTITPFPVLSVTLKCHGTESDLPCDITRAHLLYSFLGVTSCVSLSAFLKSSTSEKRARA